MESSPRPGGWEKAPLCVNGDGSSTEVEYRAAWARTYLKQAGLLENSERAVWSLTASGHETEEVDAKEIQRQVRRMPRQRREEREAPDEASEDDTELGWERQLLSILGTMDPIAFERLCQRMLRESGFTEVELTGRSGDGGIDRWWASCDFCQWSRREEPTHRPLPSQEGKSR